MIRLTIEVQIDGRAPLVLRTGGLIRSASKAVAPLRLAWLRVKMATINPLAPADQMSELVHKINNLERGTR